MYHTLRGIARATSSTSNTTDERPVMLQKIMKRKNKKGDILSVYQKCFEYTLRIIGKNDTVIGRLASIMG